MLASLAGSPDGLSLERTKEPVVVAGVENVSVAVNGTKFAVIQSPCACAGACASTLPLASKSLTGKLASKYQPPRASPVTVNGLLTTELAAGPETVISAAVLLTLDTAASEDDEDAFCGSIGAVAVQPAMKTADIARNVRGEICIG